MSFVDTITKRGSGRPRKNTPANGALSPVAAALAEPLPAGLSAAAEAVRVAKQRHDDASTAHSEARSPVHKNSNEVKKASEALAEAAVLAEMRHPDAPSEDEIKELQNVLARAKAADNETGTRVQALAQYMERCADEWRVTHAALRDLIQPWRNNVAEAIRQQLRDEIPAVAEAFAAANALRRREPLEVFNMSSIRETKPVDLPPDMAAALRVEDRTPPFKM